MNHDLLEVDPPVARENRKQLLYALAALLQELPKVTVQGLATVQRAVVKADSDTPGRPVPPRQPCLSLLVGTC